MDSFHGWTLLEDDAVAEDNVVHPLTVLEEFPELDRLLEQA